jgi:IS5 family transposase
MSTKNGAKSRDPEMHRCKKGNERHFGMKAHIGVDAGNGTAHGVSTTMANVSDIAETGKSIREDDGFVDADADYTWIEKRKEGKDKAKRAFVEGEAVARKREAVLYKEAMNRPKYIRRPGWSG